MHDSGVTVQSLLDEDGPVSESWDPIMHISENGLPRLTMTAAYLANFETQDSTYMVLSSLGVDSSQVRVDIFDARGDSSATVFANRIVYFERERRFNAEGKVVVQAKDNRFLYAEHLSWSEKTSRVHTPGYATIKTPKETLSGYEFDSDENLFDFSLKRVTGTLISEDE
jgi:hypothetical protein